jgi:WD40 repeat protein
MCRRFPLVAAACFLLAVCHDAVSQVPSVKKRVDAYGDPLPDGAIARLGSTRYRHGGKQLLGLAVDGKTLLLHGSGAIHWMDVATGKFSKTVRCGEEKMAAGPPRGRQGQAAALSGDRTVLVYADDQDNAFGIMDAVTGKELKRIKASDLFKNGGGSVDRTRFQLSQDAKVLAVFGDRFSNLPLTWADTMTGQYLHAVERPKGGRWLHAQLSHDGKQVVAAGLNEGPNGQQARLYIFDVASAKEVRSLDVGAAHNQMSFAFALRQDGKTLVGWWADEFFMGNKGDPVRLYDMTAEKQLKEIRALGDISFGGSVALSPDGKQAYIRNGGMIADWDVDGGRQQRVIDLALGNNESSRFGQNQYRPPLALSLDGKLLAIAGSKAVAVYDLANNQQITPKGSGTVPAMVHFAPDSQTLVTCAGGNHWIWDVKNAKPLHQLAQPANNGRPLLGDFLTSLFGAVAFSSDGKLLAVIQAEGGVDVWDAASGKHLHHLTDGGDLWIPTGFAFAPHGHLLASDGQDRTVRLWDASTGKQLQQWTWYAGDGKGRNDAGLLCLAFSPDGKTLAATGFVSLDGAERHGGTLVILLWETATGRERLRLRTNLDFTSEGLDDVRLILDQLPMSMRFSPDGKTLALGSFTTLHLIDTFTGKDVRSFTTRRCIGKTATFSRDGKSLFLGCQDGGLRVLDAATGRVVRDVAGHAEVILSLALSPDGKTLASGSTDGTVLLWDVNHIVQPLPPAKPVVDAKQLEALWNALADADAAKAYQAMHQLASSPAEAAPLLRAKLKPIEPVEQQVLDKLFADLDSKSFKVRDQAVSELDKLGDLALDALHKRLAQKPTLEMRQRCDKLLAKLQGPVPPAMLQQMRAIEALERMGTPEALDVLEAIAEGARGHRVTEDAQAAAKRLKNQGRCFPLAP